MQKVQGWVCRIAGIALVLGAVQWIFTGDVEGGAYRLQIGSWWGFTAAVLIGLGLIRLSHSVLNATLRKDPSEPLSTTDSSSKSSR